MKRLLLSLLAAGLLLLGISAAQTLFGEMLFLDHYAAENARVKTAGRQPSVVFIGDSIFEIWMQMRSVFFDSNDYLCRGVGGNTSPQVLIRFRPDVIELHPRIVVIGIGTNDIAGGAGPYDERYTLGNIRSCAELARANGIEVILSSVLPAAAFGWNPAVTGVPAKIDSLNAKIAAYAAEQGFGYADFNAFLREGEALAPQYDSSDGVHPNREAYQVMESIVEAEIAKILQLRQ